MRMSIQDSAHAGLGSTNNLLEQVALATHGAVVKNLPANQEMQKIQVQFLGQKDSLE